MLALNGFFQMSNSVFQVEVVGNEFPVIVNALVRLSRSRRISLLTFLGFPANEIPEKLSGEFVRIEADGWYGQEIEIFQSDNEKWDWKPKSRDKTADSSRRTGIVPTDFCIDVCADRDFSWVSAAIPLNDGTSARFFGDTIGGLMKFTIGEQRRHTAKVEYLNKHPERLDEDLIALQEELDSEDFEQRS